MDLNNFHTINVSFNTKERTALTSNSSTVTVREKIADSCSSVHHNHFP